MDAADWSTNAYRMTVGNLISEEINNIITDNRTRFMIKAFYLIILDFIFEEFSFLSLLRRIPMINSAIAIATREGIHSKVVIC